MNDEDGAGWEQQQALEEYQQWCEDEEAQAEYFAWLQTLRGFYDE